jgi:hypothetical protein
VNLLDVPTVVLGGGYPRLGAVRARRSRTSWPAGGVALPVALRASTLGARLHAGRRYAIVRALVENAAF